MYTVTVPMYVFITYEVDASTEDEALDADMPALPHDSPQSVVVPHGMSIRSGGRDNILWDRAEVTP